MIDERYFYSRSIKRDNKPVKPFQEMFQRDAPHGNERLLTSYTLSSGPINRRSGGQFERSIYGGKRYPIDFF